jgi:hypothetical protein
MKSWAMGLAAFLGAATSCLAADIVDNSGTARNGKVGYWSSLVAKGGQVGISYYCEDDTNNSPPDYFALRFAWVSDGHTWHWVTLDSNSGSDTSMARASDGFYHILYASATGMGWAVGANVVWTVSSVPIPGGVYPSNISMVLDRNDRPHVTYMNWANGGDHSFRYTYFDGVGWVTGSSEIIGADLWTPTIGFSNTALALDASGSPHVTYALPSDPINAYGDIRYATLSNGSWVHESLNTQGVDPSLRIGTDNVPRIAFTQGDDIIYASKPGATWVFESLAADVPWLTGASSLTLALNAANVPYLSFEMGASEDLFLATRTPSGWTVTMVDGDGLPDGSLLLGRLGTGLDIDDNGIPHTSYSAIEFYAGGWRTDLRYTGPGGGGPPPCITITRSPAPVFICNGQPASFDVLATGTDPLSYQWQWQPDGMTAWIDTLEGVNLDPRTLLPAFVATGHDTTTLDLPGDAIAPDLNCQFRCFVSSTCGTAASQAAALSASGGVEIIAHPQDAYSCPKGPVSFSVVAAGADSYQWQMQNPDNGAWLDIAEGQNETPVFFTATGANASGLLLSDFLDDDSPPHQFAGSLDLRCLITSSCGELASNPAELTVCPADFNCDAQVDFFDYLDFALAFSNETESADFNLDGQIDFFDYLDFVQAFGAGC